MTIDEQIAEIDKTIAMLVKARKELKEKQRIEDCIDRKQLLDLMAKPLIQPMPPIPPDYRSYVELTLHTGSLYKS